MPQTVLSLAKTTPPTLSLVLNRERLFESLAATEGRRSLWIMGPPGSGKTTLAASYVRSTDVKALWYQLDADDADAASFFFYLRQSALKHSKGCTGALPELPGNDSDWPHYGRRLFRALFRRFGQPLVVVFDNYESIPPHSPLHAIFGLAVEEVPARSRLAFISRALPPVEFARARANGLVSELGAEELALTEAECRELALTRRVDIAPEFLARIFQAGAGWVTGTILLLEFLHRVKNVTPDFFESQASVLYDYVAQEIFAGFDRTSQEFLLKVCWARRLNLTLAERISEEPMTRQLLANLARNNYFVSERQDALEVEYILHPLLRDFLKARALKVLGAAPADLLKKKTAALLIDEGKPEEAVELLVDLMDWGALESLILVHAPMLLEQGRAKLLTTWLEELPQDRLRANAWLLYWLGRSRMADSAREARHALEAAWHRFRESGVRDALGLRLCVGTLIATVFREMDDFSLLDPWIDTWNQIAPGEADGAQGTADRGAEMTLLAALALRQPQNVHLQQRLRHAEEDFKNARSGASGDLQPEWLALALILVGELERAAELLAVQPTAETDPAPRRLPALLLRLLHATLIGNLELSRTLVPICLQLAADQSCRDLVPLIQACAAATALADHDSPNADEALRVLSAAENENRLARCLGLFLASWRALIGDDVISAHHLQRRAQGCAVELGMPSLEAVSRSAYAQLLFLCGDSRGAAAQLRRVHSVARDLHNPWLEFMTLLVYADMALEQGNAASGENALRFALGLGRQLGYYQVLWWQPARLADLLVKALRKGMELDYVRDFICRNRLEPGTPPVSVPDWPWPYTIVTLGRFSVCARHETGDLVERIKGRPLQLLKALIALGGAEVPAQQVAELLWPHVDSEYSAKSLTINLHRLRRLLGNDDLLLLDDGRLTLNSALCWLDVTALDACVSEIEANGVGQARDTVDQMSETLLRIYGGPFLPKDGDDDCVSQRRETCRASFVRGLAQLAGRLNSEQRNAEAIALYEMGLRLDPAVEALTQPTQPTDV